MKTRGTDHTLWLLFAAFFIAAGLLTYGVSRRRTPEPDRASLGNDSLSLDESTPSSSDPSSSKKAADKRNSRKTAQAEAAAQAKAMVARLTPLAAKSTSGEPPGPGDQETIMGLMEEISHFDSAQFSLLVGEIKESSELNDNAKAQTCGFILTVMANTDPAAALEILAEAKPLFKGNQEAGVSVITLLDAVSDTDPTMAADWLSKHHDICGEGMQFEEAGNRILKAAAKQDPALAFTLMDRMGVTNTAQAMNGIVSSARTNQERSALLDAMRAKVSVMTDPAAAETLRTQLLSAMGLAMSRDPSAKTEEFLNSTGLGDGERKTLLDARDRMNARTGP